jgi:CRP-like cAMP-binding protein
MVRGPDLRSEVWAGVPLFRTLSLSELREVGRRLRHRTYLKGEAVFEQGRPGNGLCIVQTGTVDIFQTEDDGVVLSLSRVGPGGFFGELALLDEAQRTATAVAAEASAVAVLARADLLNLAESRPKLGVRVLLELSQVVADRLRYTNRSLKDVRLEAAALGGRPEEGG